MKKPQVEQQRRDPSSNVYPESFVISRFFQVKVFFLSDSDITYTLQIHIVDA